MDSIRKVKHMKVIEDIVPKCHSELIDLLHKCLEIDPKKRITCE